MGLGADSICLAALVLVRDLLGALAPLLHNLEEAQVQEVLLVERSGKSWQFRTDLTVGAKVFLRCLTPKLTGAVARSAEGTNTGPGQYWHPS